MSFRTRLLAISLGTLAVGLGALVLLGNVLLAQRVDTEASDRLRALAQAQIAALDVTPAGVRVRPAANDQTLDRDSWVLDGARVAERPPGVAPAVDRQAVALGRARRTAERTLDDRDLRLRAVALRPPGASRAVGAVVVRYDTASLERLQEAVLLGSLIFAALVMLAGGLATRSAIRGALEPVAQMTASADDWGAHDLERRFALGPARDELTALAATLDGLLARIAASRRHEQRFAAEVAHELRTPLAGLRARAEDALRADPPAQRSALEAVVEQAERLGRTIDTLLAVTRQELDPAEGTVDLAALARELEDVIVQVPDGLPPAEGDPDVVRRAIAPLVDNARRHGGGAVRVSVRATGAEVVLAVRDDGPGVPEAAAASVFDPGVTAGGGGAGLGLALARRLARSCGGDVRLVPGGPGACFELVLPRLGGGAA